MIRIEDYKVDASPQHTLSIADPIQLHITGRRPPWQGEVVAGGGRPWQEEVEPRHEEAEPRPEGPEEAEPQEE